MCIPSKPKMPAAPTPGSTASGVSGLPWLSWTADENGNVINNDKGGQRGLFLRRASGSSGISGVGTDRRDDRDDRRRDRERNDTYVPNGYNRMKEAYKHGGFSDMGALAINPKKYRASRMREERDYGTRKNRGDGNGASRGKVRSSGGRVVGGI